MNLRWCFVLGAAACGACAGWGPAAALRPGALASLAPTAGQTVQGDVNFYPAADRVVARVRLVGLQPGAEHGWHLHEKGDCNSADASSAGGLFGPARGLPKLRADASGSVDLEIELRGLTLDTGPAGIVGRSLVVDAGTRDDPGRAASGAAPRLACGVIAARSGA